MKLGKLPHVPDHRDLQFAAYRTTAPLPALPAAYGHEKLVASWGLLGNDSYGDCVWAGGAHETMMWCAEAGVHTAFSDKSVLSDYSAATGFKASDPSTDNGTNVRDALNYRRSTGLLDANGKRHKIGAYVALEPSNWHAIKEALYIFGAVAIGIEFPGSAMDQFNAGKPWSVVRGAKTDGGHYVPVVAFRGGELECVTWGKTQRMTKAFFEKYCDEAWALLSTEMLKGGKSPEGFDLAALQADLKAVG